jgi:quinol monooxygenase YgiN
MKPHVTELVVIASATSAKGKERELVAALSAVAAPTRAQRGCIDFVLIRPKDQPGTFIAYERWASVADHQAHLQGDHVKALTQAMGPILAAPPAITVCEVVGA